MISLVNSNGNGNNKPKESYYINDIHTNINKNLSFFLENNNVPHILFYGESGSGKRTVVNQFINTIYNNDPELIKNYVMYINCAHGKGIKFIREELKLFAKSHINIENENSINKFKSIILSNADKLTIDAQSALRRCIEIFSNTTRFFIIVENKDKLLKPIISRLCLIYIPCVEINNTKINNTKINNTKINNTKINLYKYGVEKTYNLSSYTEKRNNSLKKEISKYKTEINDIVQDKKLLHLLDCSARLYEKGYSAIDIITYIENNNIFFTKSHEDEIYKYKLLITFNKMKKEIRNEKIMIFFILKFIFLRSMIDLENILIM